MSHVCGAKRNFLRFSQKQFRYNLRYSDIVEVYKYKYFSDKNITHIISGFVSMYSYNIHVPSEVRDVA